MDDLTIVICNWNKRDDVIRCLDSLKTAVPEETQVIVVDNASTDGSVEALEAYSGRPIHLLKNEENLGGTGGFNSGIREALKGKCQYVHLLDNDVIVEEQTFRSSLSLMEKKPEIGAVGSKLYKLEKPSTLQEMGALIDWDKCTIKPLHEGIPDSDEVPKLVECDYVPACSVMVRADLIREVGLMNESYFLYWDDIEWFHRFRRLGKKVVAHEGSKAWHKMGVRTRKNTAGTYYFQRNRIHFFAQNIQDDKLDDCSKTIFTDLFQAHCFSRLEGKNMTSKTILRSARDALVGIRGQAPTGRIFQREPAKNRFKQWVRTQEKIALHGRKFPKAMAAAIEAIKETRPDLEVIFCEDEGEEGYPVIPFDLPVLPRNEVNGYSACRVLDHIADTKESTRNGFDCCVDRYLNVVHTDADWEALATYASRLDEALRKHLPVIRRMVGELRTRK